MYLKAKAEFGWKRWSRQWMAHLVCLWLPSGSPACESAPSTIGRITLEENSTGKPGAGKPHAGLCVQLRLACSAGDRPAGVRISSPVAWIAGWRETKILKPIDRISIREIASHRAVMKMNAEVAPKVRSLEGRARSPRAKAAWAVDKLNGTTAPLRRGDSDGTMTRTC